jgi:hypothetical protein
MNSDPYGVGREINPQTGDYVFRLKVHKEPRRDWAAIIGDAVHNLRSALDHLMVALVEFNGGTVTSATEFPIFENVQSYKAKKSGKVAGASQKAIDLIDEAKPFKGGNDGLWLIHKLDIIDKHRTLVAGYGSYTIGYDTLKGLRAAGAPIPPGESMIAWIRPATPIRCPLEDGDELYRVAADQIGKVDDNPTFRIEIAFSEPGVLECEPIFPLLGDLSDLVKRVALTLSASCL